MSSKTVPAAPTDAELLAQMGHEAHQAFRAFLEAHDDLRPEWKYYGQKHGFSLKLFEKKRNLCFLGARDGHFVVGFIFGEAAVERALASTLHEDLKRELREARQYPEGRGVGVTIRTTTDLAAVETLLEIKRQR